MLYCCNRWCAPKLSRLGLLWEFCWGVFKLSKFAGFVLQFQLWLCCPLKACSEVSRLLRPQAAQGQKSRHWGGLLMNRFRITLFAVLFFLVPLAFSQTIQTGDITGVITDTSGAVVPGATVVLKSIDNGETRTLTTNG